MLLIIGDRSSSDVGVIGSIGEDWHILGLEEADTPRLPLDKDGNETVLVALEIDLSSSQKLRTSIAGEDVELPPPPVMYAYTSDGTVQAWYVVNAQGMAYPGMMPLSPSLLGSSTIQDQGGASSAFVSGTSMSPTQSQAVTTGAFGQQSTLMSGGQGSAFSSQTPPGFGRPSQMPATFGQATFTQASASGQPSVFGQPSFGQPSAFGQAKPITESAFPSKFGQTSFGFGATAAPSTTFPAALVSTAPPPQPVASSAEYEMSMDAGSSFGGLSLGTDSGEKLKFGLGKGIFGRYNPSPLSLPPDHSANTPAFSTSFEAIKPAAGFGIGTFVQQQSPSQCLPQSSEQGIPAPSSAFGKSGFSAKPSSAFGQSSFSAALPVITAPVSGGFGEYASGGPTTFGTASHSEATAKPSWSIGGGGGGGVLGASSEETTSNTVGSASTFGGGSSLVFSSAPVKSSATADAFPSSPSSSGSGSPPNFRVNNSSSASPFVGHSPAGAFGQLKTSSMSFVKPATGAFGSDAMPASSPFFNTSSATNLSVSVFATSSPSSPPATNIGTSTPTFGASSVLGTAKPAIGTSPITPSPVKPSTAATSAFSKYTGPSVGFSIVPSASKPVAALLNSGDDARDPEKSSISLSTPAPKPSGDTKVTSATSTPKAGVFDNDGERSSFMADGAVRQKSVDPMVQPPVTSMADSTNFMVPVFSKPREDTIASPVDEMGKEKDSDSVPAVKMDAEASGSDQAEESGMEHASCSDEVKHLEQLEDDTQSFLSASLSGDSEGPPDDEYTSDETGSSSSSLPVEPFNIPLPITPQSTSRSPSATPKLAVIEATSSPSQRSPSPKVRDASTTPPGSPVKELSSLLPKSPLLAPTPVLPSALGLGLARPSTRPARSSPLANVTLSDADEGDRIAQSKVASPKETPKAHPASPKPTFGLLKFPTKPSTPDEEPSGNKAARPKTPPLLSSFITPAPKTPTVTLSTASPPPPPLLVDKPGGIKPTASTAMHQSNPDVFGGRAEGLPLPAFASSGLSGSKMVTSSSSNPAAFMPNETPTMSSSKTVQTATPTLMPLERPLEQGIQAECLYLFSSLGKDIEEVIRPEILILSPLIHYSLVTQIRSTCGQKKDGARQAI